MVKITLSVKWVQNKRKELKNDPSKIPVKNLMTKNVEMINSEHTVQQAAKIMEKDDVGSIVAMHDGNPVGIMTERDFVTKIVSQNYPLSAKISDVMTSPVIHIKSEDSVLEASNVMIKNKIRKIPVIDAGKVSGIITATDILRFFRFSTIERLKWTCPLHNNSELVKIELSDGTSRLYCDKCEEFFEFDK